MTLVLVGTAVVLHGSMQGMLSSPWAPFWFSNAGRTGGQLAGSPEVPVEIKPDPSDLSFGHGRVSDVQRYILARYVGWNREDAILATAISIAEDTSGDPAALSGTNDNGTRDLGLWQINSIHWPLYGGAQALTDPLNNARAAFSIYGRQGWCAWSTYERTPTCGRGHVAAYLTYMSRARAAADTPLPSGQA